MRAYHLRIISQGMRPALIGIAIGLVAALSLARLMTTLLYGVPPIDPPTFVAVAVILVLVALAACYFPARSATRVDAVPGGRLAGAPQDDVRDDEGFDHGSVREALNRCGSENSSLTAP